ncbi:MAG TPA: hypothetical protein VLS28_10085 [Candidatus Sulfomarinibacteraceae bacterium]|nr:hypothetical protein [Candidatus Sulfomarinibacteraceae bacterium]
MTIGAEVYRAVAETDDLASGDIALLSLARTRVVGEGPPGEAYDPVGRIPGYPTPALVPLPHGREIALDTMFGLVVTHSCEIDRQKNAGAGADHIDCRLTVAPIVPEPNVHLIGPTGHDQTVGWSAIEANAPVASLYLPPVPDLSAIVAGLDPLPWPRSFADLRGLATVSRRMVEADRLMGLAPAYVGVLQRQLARFFTWRDLARHETVAALVGRRVVDAIPLNASGDRIRVALTADDGTSITVELRGS